VRDGSDVILCLVTTGDQDVYILRCHSHGWRRIDRHRGGPGSQALTDVHSRRHVSVQLQSGGVIKDAHTVGTA